MRLAMAVAAGLALAGFGAGFAAFVATAHQATPIPPEADGIVALTGGAERVETALHLLAADRARLLLVSGVSHSAALSDLLHRAGLEEQPIASRVTLGRAATTTWGNAEETAEWARLHDIRSLIVVTTGFHMARAILELHRAMPGVALYPMSVQPQSVGQLSSMRLLLEEYLKLMAAWAGASQVIRQPLSTVLRTPVDNSVNG